MRKITSEGCRTIRYLDLWYHVSHVAQERQLRKKLGIRPWYTNQEFREWFTVISHFSSFFCSVTDCTPSISTTSTLTNIILFKGNIFTCMLFLLPISPMTPYFQQPLHPIRFFNLLSFTRPHRVHLYIHILLFWVKQKWSKRAWENGARYLKWKNSHRTTILKFWLGASGFETGDGVRKVVIRVGPSDTASMAKVLARVRATETTVLLEDVFCRPANPWGRRKSKWVVSHGFVWYCSSLNATRVLVGEGSLFSLPLGTDWNVIKHCEHPAPLQEESIVHAFLLKILKSDGFMVKDTIESSATLVKGIFCSLLGQKQQEQ